MSLSGQVRSAVRFFAESKTRAAASLELLRVSIGIIWALNMVFILAPSNQYFPTFQSTAQGFGSQTLGGPAIANFVATYPMFFAWLIAVASLYLALAFLFGVTTRLACAVGIVASLFFFWTQYTMTFMFPGGTDVGAHPLYIVIYLALVVGGAGQYFSIDAQLWSTRLSHYPRLLGVIAAPRARGPSNEDDTGRASESAIGRIGDASPHPEVVTPALPRSGGVGSSVAARSVALVTIIGAALMLVMAVQAMGATSPAPASVTLVAVDWAFEYPGSAASGAFGPANQTDQCAECPMQLASSPNFYQYVMITNEANTTQTVTSVTVNAPFTLILGVTTPYEVAPHGGMLMQGLTVSTPSAPGSYTLVITFDTS